MYLKSIEVQGFKSFANKIKFDFHQGITGIVGPNGSGKSNVADAVRWVLGEQSVKQLRGSSMQDVIFAGTENRKPLSYAYVAITLDNSDHQLAIEFEEVTVARRLYRSGESEYLINGSPCRLKEVSELFYDTGIGKEGYSIIGQGQIDRILSGKPEDRRELFDEAAGIVKFKKRKATAQKKLANERENLVRVNDILAELERQVGPLERQSDKAKTYLKKKSELKGYDINMFLMESKRISEERSTTEEKFHITDEELKAGNAASENIKKEYEKLGQSLTGIDEQIESIREQMSNTSVMKEKLESQIEILKEQIHTAETTDEHLSGRLASIDEEKDLRFKERATHEEQRKEFDAQLAEVSKRKAEAEAELASAQSESAACSEKIESGQKELIELLNKKAEIHSDQQHFDTMLEQTNIRKAELGKRLLARKTQEADLSQELVGYQESYDEVSAGIKKLTEKEQKLREKDRSWRQKKSENSKNLEEKQTAFHRQQSRLESLKNIAERYDGYGNSIKKVMEQKSRNSGLLGVVSDLLQVEKKYETAIETALGGSIQNIVTEDEATAKEMIGFLKRNRFGRATFLPLTTVKPKNNPRNQEALGEPGVLGIANTLVHCDPKFDGIAAYLLGRAIVVDNIDNASALAKKFRYSLHIVTLEGEHLSPGGSMSGGAFKNSSNLLARNRQIDDIERDLVSIKKDIEELKSRREDIQTAIELNDEELKEIVDELQKQYLLQNTAKMNLDQATQQREESEAVFTGLMDEKKQIELQIEQIDFNKEETLKQIEQSDIREAEIHKEIEALQGKLEECGAGETAASNVLSEILLEEANISQNLQFTQTNIDRIDGEIKKFDSEREELLENAKHSKDDIAKKQNDIEEIKKTIEASAGSHGELQDKLNESLAKKEQMNEEYRGFFAKQEEVTKRIANLDKELYRLNSQLEKLKADAEYQTNYLWEEYELTPHAALELKDDQYDDPAALKKLVATVKDEIKSLGDVNVNAIEEYREVSERYNFLKGQHDDLVEAEQTLIGVIDDLDTGMRKQFTEKFAEIQREFNSSFKQLFGGGHGSLELVEDEDILECGIKIIAQPPGKKLQNMMQMSGGEKALTAIALLFAIQALKPSPFCLLDEIEAALDDSNVNRYAKYLGKLTKDTQFIIITHRRGTMAAADRLYGITMQEKGVSTLVSVNLIENDLDE
jgi:chromosome segregation protein